MSDETMVATFPPRTELDVEVYLMDEVVSGYLDQEPGDPAPGPNHSPGYRWGWTNRARDRQPHDDGFDAIRHAHILARRARAKAGVPHAR